MIKIAVLDAGTLAMAPQEWEALRSLGDCAFFENTPHDDKALIKERCKDARVVLTNKVPLTKEVLNQLPALGCVCVLATGYNVVDTKAARERKIPVCNVPAYSTDSVVQHTLALLLALTNHVSAYNASVHGGDWIRSEKFWYPLAPVSELAGKTAGIVGFGAIGRKVAQVFHAMGMKILASTRTPKNAPPWPDFKWGSLDDIFAQSDVVSLHCPLTAETRAIVDVCRLKSMKPTAFLINTARGPLIDEAALAQALKKGAIAGAALDVLCEEPMSPACPLLDAPHCLITPHVAWASQEATGRLFQITLDNVRAFLNGTPRNVVN